MGAILNPLRENFQELKSALCDTKPVNYLLSVKSHFSAFFDARIGGGR